MIGRHKKPRPAPTVHNPPPMATVRPRPALDVVWILWLAPINAVAGTPGYDPAALEDINLGGVYATEPDARAALARFPVPASHNIQRVPIGFDMFGRIEMTRVGDAPEGENGS